MDAVWHSLCSSQLCSGIGRREERKDGERIVSGWASTSSTVVSLNGRSQATLWADGGSTAFVRTIPRSLVIAVSGDFTYDHVVELCFHVGRQWKSRQEQLVLDFTHLGSADSDGIHFLVSQLVRVAGQGPGQIYLVQPPVEARSLLARTSGQPGIHFVQTLKDAVLE